MAHSQEDKDLTPAEREQRLAQALAQEVRRDLAPFNTLTDTMRELCNELKVERGVDFVEKFNGESNDKFVTWLKSMERTKLRMGGDDDSMRSLALATLQGPAADYLLRLLNDNPALGWDAIAQLLKARYWDLSDARCAQQFLRTLKQNKDESVQNFSERIYSAALQAHPDVPFENNTTLQGLLIEVLLNGLSNRSIVAKVIRANPRSFSEAVQRAAEEQQILRSINMHNKHRMNNVDLSNHRVEEPMEIGETVTPPSLRNRTK